MSVTFKESLLRKLQEKVTTIQKVTGESYRKDRKLRVRIKQST